MRMFSVLSVCRALKNQTGLLLLFLIIGLLFLSLFALFETASRGRRAENRCLQFSEDIFSHRDQPFRSNGFQMQCYFFTGEGKLVLSALDVSDQLLKKEPIPRILHRTWKAEDPAPYGWTDGASSCHQKDARGFYLCDWTETDMDKLIASEYPAFLPTYDSYRYRTQRLNAARYFIVNHFGGLYLDLDHDCNFPFTQFLDNFSLYDVVLAEKNSPSVGLASGFILSRPRQAFWSHVMNNLPNSNKWYGLAYDTVMYSTGRMHLSNCHAIYSNNLSRSNSSRIATIPLATITQMISKSMAEPSWHSLKRRVWIQCYRWRYIIVFLAFFTVLLFLNCRLVKNM